MATKRKSNTPGDPPGPAQLTMSRDEARAKLSARIQSGRKLGERFSQLLISPFTGKPQDNGADQWLVEQQKWSQYNYEMLRRMFTTTEYAENYRAIGMFGFIDDEPGLKAGEAMEWLSGQLGELESLVARLELIDEPLTAARASADPEHSRVESAPNSNVFVVHGRDTAAKTEVARVLERAGLKPVILHEQANAGRTIIEKFEAHGGAAGFAVVLLTPDDVGGLSADELHPRARQNVIGEMFWFAGKLGRNRVCALKKGKVELPSDFAGIGYTDMDDHGAWRAELLKELAAAGYQVDWPNAMA
jgi:predicted nucleotide-binding protein